MGRWLTPNSIPASNTRRVLLLPDSPEWRAAFRGALLMLSDAANWEQFGTLTAEETADKWLEVFETFEEGEICP
jgi:hypothetical protein